MIFIVEDDENIRQLEEYAIRNSCYEVKGMENGDELFAELKSVRPELILLDVMLPETDGIPYGIFLQLAYVFIVFNNKYHSVLRIMLFAPAPYARPRVRSCFAPFLPLIKGIFAAVFLVKPLEALIIRVF